MVLPQSFLSAPHLHRAPARGGAPGARRTLRLAQRLIALGMALGGKAGVRLGHPPAPAPQAATARLAHPPGAGSGRFCPAETAHLGHDPGGRGAPAARGTPAGSYR